MRMWTSFAKLAERRQINPEVAGSSPVLVFCLSSFLLPNYFANKILHFHLFWVLQSWGVLCTKCMVHSFSLNDLNWVLTMFDRLRGVILNRLGRVWFGYGKDCLRYVLMRYRTTKWKSELSIKRSKMRLVLITIVINITSLVLFEDSSGNLRYGIISDSGFIPQRPT